MVDYVAKTSTIGAIRFDCTHIKNSLQESGVCILPLNEAVAYCNADRQCGGIGITNDKNYHDHYDKSGRMPAAELFKGRTTKPNEEWTLYVKQ